MIIRIVLAAALAFAVVACNDDQEKECASKGGVMMKIAQRPYHACMKIDTIPLQSK